MEDSTQQRYLVGLSESNFEDREFWLVTAPDEQAAFQKFVDWFAPEDEVFIEYLYSHSSNMSFAEQFWLQSSEETGSFMETGEVGINEDEFERRVRIFFEEKPDFGDLFLNYYFGEENYPTISPFPKEMIIYLWNKENSNIVNIISFNEIPEI